MFLRRSLGVTILALIAGATSAKAQTAAEAVDWLNANLTTVNSSFTLSEQSMVYTFSNITGSFDTYWRETITFSDVKLISVTCGRECTVKFTGGAEECTKDKQPNQEISDWACTSSEPIEVGFRSSISAQRIYNAFAKLAVLNGAHLTNPNVF